MNFSLKSIRKILILSIFILFNLELFSQTEDKIIIGKFPKEVPEGKCWKLETGKPLIVELAYGSLKSGTLCNARLLSKPSIVFNITSWLSSQPDNSYSIVFENLKKVPYSNNLTYTITPITIVSSELDYFLLDNSNIDGVGEKEIAFMPGTTLSVVNCLESIQLTEHILTRDEIQQLKKEDELKINIEKIKKQNEDAKLKTQKINNLINGKNFEGQDFDSREDITNKEEIGLIYTDNFYKIMTDYFIEINKAFPENESYHLKSYDDGYIDKSWGAKLIYHTRFYFNKSGELEKIIDNIKKEGEPYANYTPILDVYLQKIKKEISITKPAFYEFEGVKYFINFCVWFRFNHISVKTPSLTSVVIKKDKMGELEILSINNQGITKLNQKTIIELIKRYPEYPKYSKGKYLITIREIFDNNEVKVYDELTKELKTYNTNDYEVYIISGHKK